MNLHEYQAKQLFAEYGLIVPNAIVVRSVDETLAAIAAGKLDFNSKLVVKAQVHAGGRGKAGGVKLVTNEEDLLQAVRELLHTRLVTYQTTAAGQPVNEVLIEQACDIVKELYLGAVVDRSQQSIVIMASTAGGVDIEQVANDTPDQIFKVAIEPSLGIMAYQCRQLAFALGLQGEQIKQFSQIVTGIANMFVAYDFSLVEVNPLVITKDGQLLCLDGKVNIDENSLYRQEKIRNMRDPSQEDEREIQAKEWDLSYISLDGNIGCMVNGAGLAMATMDLIKLHGGEPANFLDVGGSATAQRVTEAFKIILSDDKVKAVLVNIFGGIVRCDLIAEGIIQAAKQVGIKVPVVVRLEGNLATEASQILNDSTVNVIAATSLSDAAQRVVAAIG